MANGTLAASQLEMLSQSGTGIITIVPPATDTNRTLTLPDSTGTLSTMGVGTAVASTSGTSIDFTGIPSWVNQITVMFSGVSTSGTSVKLVQLGTSAGVTTSGYASGGAIFASSTFTGSQSSAGMLIQSAVASHLLSGQMVLTRLTGNSWTSSCGFGIDTANGYIGGAGAISLAGTLDRVRITTANGTDTFDAGTINIMYEG